MQQVIKNKIGWIILVASLGYFVDIYDLLLFSIVRIQSLKGLGITQAAEVTSKGAMLINIQMLGTIIGGFAWGILGDKKGRLTVLFGSILLYSLANVLNGFVVNIFQYQILRFLAGVGLAGELGAGITLVAETMKKENRGYGTMIVAAVGILGAVVAYWVAGKFEWRIAYFVGGGLGFMLLIMRIGVAESGIFTQQKDSTVKKGNVFDLFGNKKRFLKYLFTSFIALPIWFIIGVLIFFGREFGIALHLKDLVSPGLGVSYAYFGGSLGNLLSGFLSQRFKSRKLIIGIFIPMAGIFMFIYLNLFMVSLGTYYLICGVLGFVTGYWVLFVTIGAEQFGTNLRATAATSLPNIARGYVIPMVIFFQFLTPRMGILKGTLLIAILTLVLASIGLWKIKETYGIDLDYLEV